MGVVALLTMASSVQGVNPAYASEESDWKTFTVSAGGQSHTIHYWIIGGSVADMVPSVETFSMTITISSKANGKLIIELPRELIDSRTGADGRSGFDEEFAVFMDEANVAADEIEATNTTRTLAINFTQGT